jgi:hypothetical protein
VLPLPVAPLRLTVTIRLLLTFLMCCFLALRFPLLVVLLLVFSPLALNDGPLCAMLLDGSKMRKPDGFNRPGIQTHLCPRMFSVPSLSAKCLLILLWRASGPNSREWSMITSLKKYLPPLSSISCHPACLLICRLRPCIPALRWGVQYASQDLKITTVFSRVDIALLDTVRLVLPASQASLLSCRKSTQTLPSKGSSGSRSSVGVHVLYFLAGEIAIHIRHC